MASMVSTFETTASRVSAAVGVRGTAGLHSGGEGKDGLYFTPQYEQICPVQQYVSAGS
jgi:hypothetical protein